MHRISSFWVTKAFERDTRVTELGGSHALVELSLKYVPPALGSGAVQSKAELLLTHPSKDP